MLCCSFQFDRNQNDAMAFHFYRKIHCNNFVTRHWKSQNQNENKRKHSLSTSKSNILKTKSHSVKLLKMCAKVLCSKKKPSFQTLKEKWTISLCLRFASSNPLVSIQYFIRLEFFFSNFLLINKNVMMRMTTT